MKSLSTRAVRSFLLAAIAVSSFGLAACASDSPATPADPPATGDKLEPTLSSIQANIITPSCAIAGCHNDTKNEPGLDLSAGVTFSTVVGKPSIDNAGKTLVVPGDAANSLFFTLLTESSGKSQVMPKGLKKLSADQKAAIEQWINDGAKDD
jgi:outer membrane murein-binding lipoprotein Lpp